MKAVEILKTKWQNTTLENIDSPFDLAKFAPGKFLARISDYAETGCCSFSVTTTGIFDSEKDALSFYRYFEIARILDYDSGSLKRENHPVEDFLEHYDADFQNEIIELLGLLDEALNSRKVSKRALLAIREKYNSIFSETNPTNQIIAWGKIPELLQNDCFKELFEELIGEPDKSIQRLDKLVASKTFDEGNKQHMKLAKIFIKNCERY